MFVLDVVLGYLVLEFLLKVDSHRRRGGSISKGKRAARDHDASKWHCKRDLSAARNGLKTFFFELATT